MRSERWWYKLFLEMLSMIADIIDGQWFLIASLKWGTDSRFKLIRSLKFLLLLHLLSHLQNVVNFNWEWFFLVKHVTRLDIYIFKGRNLNLLHWNFRFIQHKFLSGLPSLHPSLSLSVSHTSPTFCFSQNYFFLQFEFSRGLRCFAYIVT